MNKILGARVLVIAAHPDDETFGCGGMIAKNSLAGGVSDILIVSEGTSAQFAHDSDARQTRHQQLLDSAALLGADRVLHWDYPDMNLDTVPHAKLNAEIASVIQEGKYQFVFTHHPHDINKDHQVVARSVMVAARPLPSTRLEGVFAFHTCSSTEWAYASNAEKFSPNCYQDITDCLDLKLKACELYVEELRQYPHPRSIEAIRNRALVFGADVGLPAAEGFSLIYWR